MLSAIARNVERVLLATIRERYGVEYERLQFMTPPRVELGEFALTTAFDLARKLKRPPRDIASELSEIAREIPGIAKAEIAGGGYLNLYLNRAPVALRLARSIEQNLHGRVGDPEFQGKIVVEHTNINPNKAAHIGHLRNAALGDSFVRCLRFLGHQVEVQNYLDNTGVQVADVVVGLERMEGKTLSEVAALDKRFDYYCWDIYARVADFYKQSEENEKLRSQTLQAIESGNNPTAELAEHVAMRIVRAHLATMARINVHYDLLPRESEILHLRFWEKAFQQLKERNVSYFVEYGRNRGCWVMRTTDRSDEGDSEPTAEDEKVIVRSDGTVTYVGKDIAYQLWKFGLLGLDFHYRQFESPGGHSLWVTTINPDSDAAAPHFGCAARVYNVIDSRQAYLQRIVLQGVQALGYEDEARNSIHFSYEMVALTPTCCEEMNLPLTDEDRKRPYIEVSGRRGLGVKADDLLDTLMEKALAEVRSRHSLPDAESSEIASKIAVGALRYFLLRFARTTIIAFDFKEALNFEGETGPYVQYAVVRANNIFRKLQESEPLPETLTPADEAPLEEFFKVHEDIWELVSQAARLPEVVRQVTQSLELAQLAKYAFYLAQRFNLFYHRYHILSEPDPVRKMHLLFVVDLVRKQLESALNLLGCEVPDKM